MHRWHYRLKHHTRNKKQNISTSKRLKSQHHLQTRQATFWAALYHMHSLGRINGCAASITSSTSLVEMEVMLPLHKWIQVYFTAWPPHLPLILDDTCFKAVGKEAQHLSSPWNSITWCKEYVHQLDCNASYATTPGVIGLAVHADVQDVVSHLAKRSICHLWGSVWRVLDWRSPEGAT